MRFEYKVILLVPRTPSDPVLVFSHVSGSGPSETLSLLEVVTPGFCWPGSMTLWELGPVGNNDDIYLCMSCFY